MPKLEPIPSVSGRGGRRGRGSRVSSSLAEINVVPLVDVMLVLLVIFMVAAPMMKQGVEVDLPQSRQTTAIEAPVTVSIPASFRRDQMVLLDAERIPLSVLAERARQSVASRTDKTVALATDASVTMGDAIAVMDLLKAGGVESVALQTQLPTRR
jgi:biopolymer transport protein ExbD